MNPIKARNTALLALANWGYLSDSRDIIKEHLVSGQLEQLAIGSLQALNVAQPSDFIEILQSLLERSSSAQIKLNALKYLSRYPWLGLSGLTYQNFDQNKATMVSRYLKQVLSNQTVLKLAQTDLLYSRILKIYKEIIEEIQSHRFDEKLSPSKVTLDADEL